MNIYKYEDLLFKIKIMIDESLESIDNDEDRGEMIDQLISYLNDQSK